jgi:hypothetical protein
VTSVPSFGELVSIAEAFAEKVPSDSMQVVLVSRATGVTQFVTVEENPAFQAELQQALLSSAIPLGILIWKRREGRLGASKSLFPWVQEDETACQVFDQICDEATEKVGELFEPGRIH